MSDAVDLVGPGLGARIRRIEARLAALEALLGSGILGTDQTIKGCHDRLDAILGEGVAAPDGALVSNFNADMVDGIHAATSATANALLALNASAKLPASVTGIAEGGAVAEVATVLDTTNRTFTDATYTEHGNSDLSLTLAAQSRIVWFYVFDYSYAGDTGNLIWRARGYVDDVGQDQITFYDEDTYSLDRRHSACLAGMTGAKSAGAHTVDLRFREDGAGTLTVYRLQGFAFSIRV